MVGNKIFRGFTYDNREYIVYMDNQYPETLVVQFPNEPKPIRVEYHSRGGDSMGDSECGEGEFRIPKEYHMDYEGWWQLHFLNNRMLISKHIGDIVFLDETDGFQWMKENYIDIPNDIYDYVTFVEFDNLYVVKYQMKYHRDKTSFNPKISFWFKDGDVIKETNVLSHGTYLDGGTFEAKLGLDSIEYDLYVPTPWGQGAKAKLNGKESTSIHRHGNDDNPDYWMLWRRFKELTDLKLYYVKQSRLSDE